MIRMRVKMLRNSVTPLRKGVVYNLPEQEAQRLFGLGAAEKEAEQAATASKSRRRGKSTDDKDESAEQAASESEDE